MAKLNITVQHAISQKKALKRIKKLLGEVKHDYSDKISNLEENWNDNLGEFSFSAMGFAVFGTIKVNSNQVELNGNLPFAASFFKDEIENVIRDRTEKLLT